MKKYTNLISIGVIGLFIFLICLAACKEKAKAVKAIDSSFDDFIENPMRSDGTIDASKTAEMTFEASSFDFGEVVEGDQLIHKFQFTNTGKQPLVITDANSTCGCTIPDWPKNPIPPGGTGEIEVKFNTSNKENRQTKPIRIFANTWPNETVIYVKAFVNTKTES